MGTTRMKSLLSSTLPEPPTQLPVPLCHLAEKDRAVWNEAAWRVRLYLTSLDLEDEVDLIVTEWAILVRAMESYAVDSKTSPVVHAYKQMRAVLTEELEMEFGAKESTRNGAFYENLLAFKLARQRKRFATFYKKEDSLREVEGIFSYPALDVASMTPRPIDYGPLPELARMGRTQWFPILHVFLFWLVIYGVGYGALIVFFHE